MRHFFGRLFLTSVLWSQKGVFYDLERLGLTSRGLWERLGPDVLLSESDMLFRNNFDRRPLTP